MVASIKRTTKDDVFIQLLMTASCLPHRNTKPAIDTMAKCLVIVSERFRAVAWLNLSVIVNEVNAALISSPRVCC